MTEVTTTDDSEAAIRREPIDIDSECPEVNERDKSLFLTDINSVSAVMYIGGLRHHQR